ncbi:MAG: hypothetical protein VYA83_01925 [Candidatus Neomarinimicrobiota bacterium]|jgi:hypothetical protein|nr:hypothetical protein [Candidatus Neomarinimicrobiota bacterium]HJL92478.1 hypothetical protein [Woeseiaceae bacterium]MEC7871499.1 hypothetical protein [Candidatus Neomarinimicrobiota bacterium]MEC9007319.1 hypothetical protein [Candidatus Neomarinimicrobiota bacterium]MEC9437015.1 hypothetical protein [Candidatus Neomarinimicrobiota bacterium]|tara:strand:- start:896 stop:1426 length:531 start_codon:yes stop_codon:yes gene_type:complete
MHFLFPILLLSLLGCSIQNSKNNAIHTSAAELNYQKYFKRNLNNIDLIEGIWYEYAVGSLYKDRLLLQRIREPNRATWIIIKDKDSKRYNVLNANGKDNYYNASFKPTSNKDIFSFDCDIKGTQTKISSKARIIEKNQLEMEYDAPKALISENYDQLDGDVVLHWKIEWIKSFPRN